MTDNNFDRALGRIGYALESTTDFMERIVGPIVFAGVMSCGIAVGYYKASEAMEKRNDPVLGKLEISLTDIDGDGKKDRVVKYNGRAYTLKDVDGKLVLQEYAMRPTLDRQPASSLQLLPAQPNVGTFTLVNDAPAPAEK
ncbi:TPA: hypothetical protein HA251_00585 [Candidatus Woesearchaeota archaeon]|nr:hypothetical protein [Candidatus Woesearchaeota archaeon]